MKNLHRFLVVTALTMAVGVVEAQTVSPVDFMRNTSKAANANPATFTPDKFYFDFLLGNVNMGFQNTGLKYDNFFDFDSNGYPILLNINKGIAKIERNNYLNTDLSLDVFNLGFRTKHGFVSFSHRIRAFESFTYSRDLLQLVANGNASFLGQDNPANLNIGLSTKAYQDFSLGWQMNITEELNVGVRMKFLMGIADARANVNGKLYTDPDSYALRLTAGADGKAALPFNLFTANGEIDYQAFDGFDINQLLRNFGGGIDLGAEYQINDQWGVAAAVNDLGWITWNSNPTRFEASLKDGGSFYHDGGIEFTGLTEDQINGMIGNPDYLSQLADSLMGYVGFDVTTERYSSLLNTSAMVRGYFDLTPNHRFSAQLLGYYTGTGIKPAATVAYTGSFDNRFDVVAMYTVMPGSYDNIGIGLSANLGIVNLFVASNNILGFFNPLNSSQLNLQFGISITSLNKVDREDAVVVWE